MSLNLDDLARAVGAMTPGPWAEDVRAIDQHSMGPLGTGPLAYYTGCTTIVEAGYNGDERPHGVVREEDCAGIVALRNAAPALIAAVRMVEKFRALGDVDAVATKPTATCIKPSTPSTAPPPGCPQ